MMRIVRLGAPALALALLAGCGAQEDAMPADTTRPAPGLPPAVDGAKDENPNPAPTRETPVAPIPSANDVTTPTPAEATPPAPGEAPKTGEPSLEGPKADADAKLTDDEIASIKKLPADEQDAAIKQAVCPVSGEHLGAMDTPIKVSAEGRTFFICCGGCKGDVEKDPKGVLAKLDKK